MERQLVALMTLLSELGSLTPQPRIDDGPIHVVGIVPDEIDAVLIDGKTIKVSNNVWHYAAPSGTNLSFVVRSVDGRTVAVGKL